MTNATNTQAIPHEDSSFYLSLVVVYIPGFIFNVIALYIIVKDANVLKLPTNTVLFLLCLCDFFALINSFIWLMVDTRYGNMAIFLCQVKTVFSPVFLFFTGILSFILAIDRCIALNLAYLYVEKITSKTWLAASAIGFVFSVCICSLPLMGYGAIWRYDPVKEIYTCSSFTYETNPIKRVFSITQPSLGMSIIFGIVVCNILTIRSVLRMKSLIHDMENQAGQREFQSQEILFANLVAVMTLCFIICWAPFNLLNILRAVGDPPSPAAHGFIHLLAGLSFVVDPILYVWIRKSVRKKVLTVCRSCTRCFKCSSTNETNAG